MSDLSYTLLTDGSSDRALIPVLNWLLYQILPDCAIQPYYADLRLLPAPPKGLSERIIKAMDLYPSQIIFVHRDAEGDSIQDRIQEIDAAINQVHERTGISLDHIAVIPVRMTEAWLLINESCIRMAAGNPNGRIQLTIPPIHRLEQLPNPKNILHDLMRQASECRGRRLKRFDEDIGLCVHRLSTLISDFSALRRLSAFQQLEENSRMKLHALGYR